jgi:hypothetical protein
MPVKEVEVKSLGDLLDKVTPVQPDPASGRFRDTGIYRGTRLGRQPLLTSLDRLGGDEKPHTKASLEEHILRNFIRYSRPYLDMPAANEWELLVVAQHHSLPTRLLDWTYSPLVAAYFATLPAPAPGETCPTIWRLDWKQVHRRFDFPELALLIQDLDQLFGKKKAFTPWSLFQGALQDGPFACMIEPPSLDARIVAQSAVFTLCSDKTRSFDSFLEAHGLSDALTRFVIPQRRIPHFRDQLDLASVDERRLFPGLDGVTAQMRRYYE